MVYLGVGARGIYATEYSQTEIPYSETTLKAWLAQNTHIALGLAIIYRQKVSYTS